MSADITSPNLDKFLFVFTPTKTDDECIFKIPLNIGVRVISIVLLISSLLEFLDALGKNEIWDLIIDVFFSVFFLVIAFFSFMSTINNNYDYSNVSYIVYALIYIIKVIEYIAKSVLIILGLVNPFGDSFFELKGIWYIIGEGVYLFILLYFIWIIYCFRHHLK